MLHETLENFAMPKQSAKMLLADLFVESAERGARRRSDDFQYSRARLRRFGSVDQIWEQHESGSVDELLKQSWHNVSSRSWASVFELA
jgi:hypothetical protein